MQKHQPISWVYSSVLSELNSLFDGAALSYAVDAYLCSCEHSEAVIIINDEECRCDMQYECPHCGNQLFHDANRLLSHSGWYASIQTIFSEETLANLSPKILFDADTKNVTFQMAVAIPCGIDLVRNKLLFQEKILYEASVSPKKMMQQKMHVNFNLPEGDEWTRMAFGIPEPKLYERINQCTILSDFKQHVLKSLKTRPPFALPKAVEQCRTLDQASVFLAYPNLNDFEFVYWEHLDLLPSDRSLSILEAFEFLSNARKEKSFKKALYFHYNALLHKQDKFDYGLIFVVSRCIKDVNIAKRMIKIDMKQHFRDKDIMDIGAYMEFLSKHYSEIQLEKLFREYAEEDVYWFEDTLQIFIDWYNIDDPFPKVRCNIRTLHEAFENYVYRDSTLESLSKMIFSYENLYQTACGEFEGFEIRLPKTGAELYTWGEQLHNCLASYADRVQLRKTTIYGFFKEDSLKIAIEVCDDAIIQASKKYNEKLNDRDMHRVKGWFERFWKQRSHMDKNVAK